MTPFRALRLHAGEPEPSRRIETLSLGDLSSGDVVVEVAWSSINYKDALASRGRNSIVRQFPRIGGIDLTGVVAESADRRFRAGDKVIVHGFGIGVDHDGGHAQVARVSGDWVMHLPEAFSLFEGAVLGAAGYTAGLSLHLMELNGLRPERGPVIVTGATGGVASVAIDMLANRGYRVTAMTGKQEAHDDLRALGANAVVGRIATTAVAKPLEKAQWAGAVDSVGGACLAWLTRTMQPEGVITAFGNAGGLALEATVLPFILRGVRLIGVNANSPMPLREEVWAKIASVYRPTQLERVAHIIELEQLPDTMDRMLAGELRGRTVIRMR
jgi:acrylyl-CoA reductase (NADPH)